MVKDSEALENINRLHKSALEKAEEKIAIAMQTYDMIDKNIQVQRLSLLPSIPLAHTRPLPATLVDPMTDRRIPQPGA